MLNEEIGKQKGIFPIEKSFVKINGDNLVLSSVKKAEDSDSTIIRLYNPTNADVDGSIEIGFDFKEAYIINLNEEREQSINNDGDSLKFKAGKGKIVSVEVI